MLRYLFLLLLFFSTVGEGIEAVYLTLGKDPTSEMVIHWVTRSEETNDIVLLKPEKETSWRYVLAESHLMPGDLPYTIHVTSLEGLKADTSYKFRVGGEDHSYKFHTLPETLSSPLRFAVGGDIYHDGLSYLEEMNKQIANYNPSFVVLGGDIAYSGTSKAKGTENGKRWIEFLTTCSETLITRKGHLIPFVPVIGNHDVNGRYDQSYEQAKCFYSFFPNAHGYDFYHAGDYLGFWALDSGHTHFIGGEQKEWLEKTLQDNQNIPYKFAAYHIPAFPSVRSFSGKYNVLVRENWVPLFEDSGVTAGFEHHEHAYKRTPLIYRGEANPEKGVFYMGDGGWGVKNPRKPRKAKKYWYLEATASKAHFVLVELTPKLSIFNAIDREGNVFDQFERANPHFSLSP